MNQIDLNAHGHSRLSRPTERHPCGTGGRPVDGRIRPGHVHTDLLRRRDPNPFYGTNECDVQWVAEHRWMYRKEFAVL